MASAALAGALNNKPAVVAASVMINVLFMVCYLLDKGV
jgi:hypothetical protein